MRSLSLSFERAALEIADFASLKAGLSIPSTSFRSRLTSPRAPFQFAIKREPAQPEAIASGWVPGLSTTAL